MTRHGVEKRQREEDEGFRVLRLGHINSTARNDKDKERIYMGCRTTLNRTSSNVLRVTAGCDRIARAELCVFTQILLARCYRYLYLIWN